MSHTVCYNVILFNVILYNVILFILDQNHSWIPKLDAGVLIMSVTPATTTDGIVELCTAVGVIFVVVEFRLVPFSAEAVVIGIVAFEVRVVAFIAVVLGACVVVSLNVGIVTGFSSIPPSENSI